MRVPDTAKLFQEDCEIPPFHGCDHSILTMYLKAPMTVDQQEEEIALLVQEHVDNPETVVTQLNTFLTPLQVQTDEIVIHNTTFRGRHCRE